MLAQQILLTLSTRFPYIIIWIIGLVLAFRTLDKNPRRSWYAISSLTLFFVVAVLGVFLSVWLPFNMVQTQGAGYDEINQVMTYLGLGDLFFTTIAWALLITALFSDKKPKTESPDTPVED